MKNAKNKGGKKDDNEQIKTIDSNVGEDECMCWND